MLVLVIALILATLIMTMLRYCLRQITALLRCTGAARRQHMHLDSLELGLETNRGVVAHSPILGIVGMIMASLIVVSTWRRSSPLLVIVTVRILQVELLRGQMLIRTMFATETM